MISDKDSLIQMLEAEISQLKNNTITSACYTELFEQKVKLESMLSKLVDILHTKEKGY